MRSENLSPAYKMVPPYSEATCASLPKLNKGISWLCWAYNEEDLIASYLRRSRDLLESVASDYEIIVVDDASTDGTNEIVRELTAEIPQLKLFRNDRNRNVGYSSQRAIKCATKEYLLWQTIDWAYDIKLLRVYLELLKEYDIVAGVRREPVIVADNIRFVKPLLGLLKLLDINHITKRSDTPSKALVSVINYALIRILFGVPISDYQNVVIYPTRVIQSLNYESASSFANPEGLIRAYWAGCRIIEVPISFIPRERGEAKGTRPGAIFNSVKDIFRLWFRWILCGKRDFKGGGFVRRLAPAEWA